MLILLDEVSIALTEYIAVSGSYLAKTKQKRTAHADMRAHLASTCHSKYISQLCHAELGARDYIGIQGSLDRERVRTHISGKRRLRREDTNKSAHTVDKGLTSAMPAHAPRKRNSVRSPLKDNLSVSMHGGLGPSSVLSGDMAGAGPISFFVVERRVIVREGLVVATTELPGG